MSPYTVERVRLTGITTLQILSSWWSVLAVVPGAGLWVVARPWIIRGHAMTPVIEAVVTILLPALGGWLVLFAGLSLYRFVFVVPLQMHEFQAQVAAAEHQKALECERRESERIRAQPSASLGAVHREGEFWLLPIENCGGAEAEFWARLVIEGPTKHPVLQEVFSRWHHTERVRTPIAPKEQYSLRLVHLIPADAGTLRQVLWTTDGGEGHTPCLDTRGMAPRLALAETWSQAVILRITIYAKPPLKEGQISKSFRFADQDLTELFEPRWDEQNPPGDSGV